MADKDGFRLQVPLDASSVKGFTTDRVVKAIAYGSSGPTLEQTVKFDQSAKGSATFSFERNPGSLTIALGPDSASSEDLKHLQTISVSVAASSWQGRNSLTIPAVPISSYYWGWWWNWCRTFTITGRVLCPDGSPVAGATVCAFDVDAWWWWISKEQVGCATTGVDGSFEIDFTRCCGWWPWWWWETRDWLLDPYLVEQITAAVKNDSSIRALPRATPQTSLAIFDQILTSAARSSRAGRLASPTVRANQLAAPGGVGANVDTSQLEPLRARLQAILPREFPLPIWPWYPWYPWLDCSANIIFQVTQNCSGQINTVVNETIADTRWDIPASLSVSLTTNSQACCAFSCSTEDCPEGNCIVPSDVCGINVGSIGGNIGSSALPSQVGLAYPGTEDRPFAGSINFYGLFGDAVNVDYYEFLYSKTGLSGLYGPLPLPAIEAFNRQVLVTVPTLQWIPVPFGPSTISDGAINHFVIETIQHYVANNGPQTWDAATYFLLLVLNSLNTLVNGPCYLQLVGWQRPGYTGNLSNPSTLTVCDTKPPENNYWVVTLDNQAPGNTDPTGQPCGLHICTDQPISDIIQVMIQHQDGSTTPVEGCGVVCVVDTDQLVVDFAAYDPDGFLDSYTLQLLYGVDESVNLLSLGTPVGSPIAPVWAPATSLVGPWYSSTGVVPNALGQGAASPVWYGGSMRLTVSATAAFPTLPCAYLMQLNVYKRPIVDCIPAGEDAQQNVSFQSFTVQACPPTP